MDIPDGRLRKADLEAIKARLAAAPNGPWRLELRDALYGYYTLQTSGGNVRIAEIWGGEERAEFIAAAPTDIAALLAEIARLEALLASPLHAGAASDDDPSKGETS